MKKKITLITVIFVVTAVMLTGCGIPQAPEGYGENPPIVYDYEQNTSAIYCLGNQFPDENKHDDLYYDKEYFVYKDELYYVKASGGSPEWLSNNDYSIYKDNGEEHIGDTIYISGKGLDKKSKCICYIMFLDENYLYYEIALHKVKTYLRFSTQGFTDHVSFYKYEFYRFNLETGENESISLDLFFEKITAIDNTVVINNY